MDITQRYEKLEKLGEGVYGKVYKARDKRTGQFVALKKSLLSMDEEGVPSTTLREISILQMLASETDYVVRLLDVEVVTEGGHQKVYLVFEYLNMDLKKFWVSKSRGASRPAPLDEIKRHMFMLCKGCADMHSHGVLHRDLKPQNLLIDVNKDIVKVGDLGLGRAFNVPMKSYTHEVVTLWYRAPEVLLGITHYATPVDMWSVGCIFGEMVANQPMFQGQSEFEQLVKIFELMGTPSERIWPGVTMLKDWHEYPQFKPKDLKAKYPVLGEDGIDLLAKLLQYDPSRRLSAKEALQHPFFKGVIIP